MNLDVSQNNLYLYLPSKVSCMADMLMTDDKINVVEAIKRIYSSDTYKRLENESSKMWHLGPVDLMQCYNQENHHKQ